MILKKNNMAVKNKNKNTGPKRPSTQKYLDIVELRDDMVILKDGTVRGVALVSSINFALKSEDEQTGVIQAYMQFLNGLDHPVEVVIQSRKMRIDEYIARMNKASAELKNELLKNQTDDYINFIKDLVEGSEIMSKRFYIVVPYDPLSNKKRNFWARAMEVITPGSRINLNDKMFNDRKRELEQRMSHVIGALNSMGLSSARLDTQGLIELYYNSYNPVVANAQPIGNASEMDIDTSYGF